MREDQILWIKRLTAQLGVEIRTTGFETTRAQHFVISQRHLWHVVWKLIGVPARLVIVAVHVDRPKDVQLTRQSEFMLKRMACQNRMALLDIYLDFAFKTKVLEEAVNSGNIIVILVLRRFLWLGLDQDRTFEAHLVFVIHDHLQHATSLLTLAPHVGVKQCFIPFATAPKNVVFAPKFDRRIHTGFDCRGGVGENVGIRVRGSARHKATVRKQVGGAPKQFHASLVHLLGEVVYDGFQIARGFCEISPFRAHICIVEAKIRDVQDLKHLEGHIGLHLGQLHRVTEPGAL